MKFSIPPATLDSLMKNAGVAKPKIVSKSNNTTDVEAALNPLAA